MDEDLREPYSLSQRVSPKHEFCRIFAAELPFSTQVGKNFYRRQEVQDLIALVRALGDSRDTIALGALSIFGTFVTERDDLPCRYGLVKPLRSNNPVVIAFHEWAALVRDLGHSRSWRDRWSYLVGPPGWQPDRERSRPETAFDAEARGQVLIVE